MQSIMSEEGCKKRYTVGEADGDGPESSTEVSSSRSNLDGELTFPDGGFQLYLVLFGSTLGLMGAVGLLNSGGTIENYVSTNMLPDVAQSTVGWIFSAQTFFSFGGPIFIGPVFDLYGHRVTSPIGICVFAVGLISFSFCKVFYQFLLSYIATAIGMAFMLVSNVGVISHFFHKKRAFALGIAFSGGAFGGIIYPLILRSLFPKLGWGWSIRVIAFIIIFLFIVSFFLTKDRTKEFRLSKVEPEEVTATKWRRFYNKTFGLIQLHAFKDRVFLTAVLAIMGSSFPFVITITYIISYAVANGYSPKNAYILLMVMNAVSIGGRLTGGFIADKYGRFNTLCVINVLSTISYFILWLPPQVGHKVGGLYTFCIVYGIASGSNIPSGPAVIGQISKTSEFAARYGTMSFFMSAANLVGIPIGGAIIGNDRSVKGFDHLVIFISCVSFVGSCFSVLSRYLYAGWSMRKV